MEFDYSIKDSSLYSDIDSSFLLDGEDNAVRIGIIREERDIGGGETRYIVEVFRKGKQIPLSCVLMTRLGGVHNYEEYRTRAWMKEPAISELAPTDTASTYDLRSGDFVIVTQLGGQGREGVILGGLKHPARKEATEYGKTQYSSSFQGLDTFIDDDGSYKVTFNGKATNTEISLDTLPSGQVIPPPEYNQEIAGSYFTFDAMGSYEVSDTLQSFNIDKVNKSTIFKSGEITTIDFGAANEEKGLKNEGFAVKTTGGIVLNAKTTDIQAETKMNISGAETSIQGDKIALGNSTFELLEGLSKLIDALGKVFTTSPIGPNTPLESSPTWAQVLAIKQQIDSITGSIQEAKTL